MGPSKYTGAGLICFSKHSGYKLWACIMASLQAEIRDWCWECRQTVYFQRNFMGRIYRWQSFYLAGPCPDTVGRKFYDMPDH